VSRFNALFKRVEYYEPSEKDLIQRSMVEPFSDKRCPRPINESITFSKPYVVRLSRKVIYDSERRLLAAEFVFIPVVPLIVCHQFIKNLPDVVVVLRQ